jgi:uncharacterized repeat protein (TIGR01451 family)/fimbrial isopeptide formation D2 family protein
MGAEIESNESKSVLISINDENSEITLNTDASIGQVTKKIWNDGNSTWVNSINAMIGEILTFNITIIYEPQLNDSALVTNITVNDTLPNCLEYSNNASVIYGFDEIFGESAISGKTIFWNLSEGIFDPYNITLWNISKPWNADKNDSLSIYYNATVVANTTSSGEENNVNVCGWETCPSRHITGEDSALIIVEEISDEPCIEIIKEVKNGMDWDNETIVNIGENVSFRLTINNCGSIDLTDVVVTDNLPSFLTYNYDAVPTPNSSSDHQMEWNYDLIPAYGSEIITFSAHADEEGEGFNVANVICCEQVTDQDQVKIKVVNYTANFTCEKLVYDSDAEEWVDILYANLNEKLTFRIVVSYFGDYVLYDMIIKDILDENFEYANNATLNGIPTEPDIIDLDNNTLIWEVDLLENGDVITIEFEAFIISENDCQGCINYVEVTTNECNGDLLICEDTVTVFISEEPVMTCDKEVYDQISDTWVEIIDANLNQTVRFRIFISYFGDYVLYNMTIIDVLPDCFEYANNATLNGISSEPDIYDEGNNTLIWYPPIIGNGENITIEFDAITKAYGICENIVNITTQECSGITLYCDDSASVNVSEGPHIECEKSVWTGFSWENDYLTADVGETVRFKITVTYLGEIALYDIWIEDILPDCFEYKNNADPFEPSINGSELLWHFAIALEYGESISVEFDAKILAPGECINLATIRANECNQGTILYCTDSVTINGIQTEDLVADAGGPYDGDIDETINIAGDAIGGIPPYNYSWDLDNDFVYDDAYGKTTSNSWDSAGTFTIRLKVTDDIGSFDTDTSTVSIGPDPVAPEKPTLSGPASGKAGEEYSYSVTTTDDNGDQILYLFDWGDGTNSGWIGPYNSGNTIESSHTWEDQGDYEIKVRAKDTTGLLSEWSDNLPISMPLFRTPITFIRELLERLIENFPILQWLSLLPIFNY